MNHRTKVITALMFAGLALPGCDLLKKAASGGKISQSDLVNSADRETVSYTHLTLPTIYSV